VRVEGGYGSVERTMGCGDDAACAEAEAAAAAAAAARAAAGTDRSSAAGDPAGVEPDVDDERGWTSPASSSSGAVAAWPPADADQATA
jgi:hypothetical protein